LLVDCHRRIERFLSVLARVIAQAHGGLLTREQQVALKTALRYFRRLRSLDRREWEAVLERISSLEHDHTRADRNHVEVDQLGQKWLASGSLAPADAERFSSLVNELALLYREHIAIEESELFPAAAAALEKMQREEMRARRGLA
jgi:hypothetical protein